MSTPHARGGAALILALVVLAALLLLGLPFLFSQSAGMTGTRSYAHHVAATTARDGAEAIAVAAVAYAMEPHWSFGYAPAADQTDLVQTLTADQPIASEDALAAGRVGNRIAIDFKTALGLNLGTVNRPTVGAAISDESGKLDVNALSPRGWDLLLKAAGIPDWDDSAHANTRNGSFDSVNNRWNSGNDADDIGELATALAQLRFTSAIPEHRITQLEQLLLADPGYNKDQIPPGQPSTNQSGKSYGFRTPLSRTELERLRPYLTVHNLGQARGGVLDLGTVGFLDDDVVNAGRTNQPVIDSQPQAWDANDLSQRSAVVQGTMLLSGVEDPAPALAGLHRGGVATGANLYTWDDRLKPTIAVDAPIGIAVPAEVNINAASTVVRGVYGTISAPASGMTALPELNAITVNTTGKPFQAWSYQAPGVPIAPPQQPFELPALGIASLGLVTIDSAAVFADAAQHQAAQRGRRVVAQAVPQEDLLERRWIRQTAYEHDLLARRFSRVASWPFPSARLVDQMPEDVDGDAQVGLAPAPLPSLDDADAAPHLINSPQRLDWKHAFAGTTGTFARHQLPPLADSGDPVNGLAPTSLTPEGVRLTNADHLAYDFSTGGNTPFLTPVVSGPNATEILPRQVSVWVRSTTDWDTGVVPILEVRMPPANAGLPLDGVSAGAQMDSRAGAGDTSLQNHWSLTYDGKNKHLVLALANPGIEHPADYGPTIPFDIPSSSLDESSLGSGTSYPSAPLAPKRPFNRVEHRYFMPLEKDRWYLIQACFSTDRPGGQSIIVDGLVGTDVALAAMHAGGAGSIELTKPGDHITVPCALLAADLPAGTSATDATNRMPIALRPVLTGSLFPNGLADMLPAHGMVRIDDEYISYESISGTSLANCRRGRRQNTDLSDANPASHQPVMPAHTAGALVVPGGYRLTAIGDILLSGGRALAAPVPNGVVCATGAHTGQVLVWSQIDTTTLTPMPSPPNPPNTVKLANAAAMTIPLKSSAGDPTDFPSRGFVIIEGAIGGTKYAYYDGVSGNSLTGVQGWYTMPPAGVVADPPTDNSDLLMSTLLPPTVVLMSIEVDGDPTSPTAYAQSGDRLIQLYDALGDGHIEWLRYTNTMLKTATSGTHGFFLNASGFFYAPGSPNPPGSSTRGVERTNFPGPTGAVSGPPWAIGARVIPVQTGSVAGIIAETGDILTLAPRAPSGVAYQVAVRFRPTDDFSAGALDTHNHYFALTEALPVAVDLGKVDVLNWPAWNGKDLSPFGPAWGGSQICGVYGCLPWTTSSTAAFATPDDRRVYLASFDERCPSPVSTIGVPSGAPTTIGSFTGSIDRPTAGEQPGTPNDVVTAISTGVIAAGAAPPFDVQASSGIFPYPYGLVEIGGEVFAYQKSNNAQIATMIARGLLGSAKTDHAVGDPILHLPLGPIGILAQDLGVGDRRKLVFTNGAQILQAPAILLSETNPTPTSPCEVIVAPRMQNGDAWGATMPWLRGMYDTPPRGWSAATTIAIGWYPRYASALPHDWNGNYQPYYRCRSYAWASFPLRFYGIDPTRSEAEVDLLDNGSLTDEGTLFDCRVAASGGAFQDFPDWGSWKTLASATAAVQAVPIDCDGVELRVCWKYAKAASGLLTDIAASGNRAPMLGAVRLRVRAPAETIAVEETR